MIEEAEPLALTGVIVTEILQGLTRDANVIERHLGMWEMLEPRGFSTHREAADIFRATRAKGITLRTINSLIAAIALERRATVFTLDKDFPQIARISAFSLYRLPA